MCKLRKNENATNINLSRRKFLKGTGTLGVAGVVTSLSTIPGLSNASSKAYATIKLGREQDKFPIEISKDYKRFDQKNTIFMRGISGDPKLLPSVQKLLHKKPKDKPGWTQLDLALNNGADLDSRHVKGIPTKFGIGNAGLYSWEGKVNENKYNFKNSEEASQIIKKASLFLGADLVGIAPYDERWVYSRSFNPMTKESVPIEFPFNPKSVIVIALEMDYDAYRTAPSLIAAAATKIAYGEMITVSSNIATFIRDLGYHAAPTGNDTSLAIPTAIQAGLGEASRMGMLITEKYGPRVRLCKVFTDLPLKVDKPITFGVQQFCEVCMKCADNCPGNAISKDLKPSFNALNISNNPGVKKWWVDGEKCLEFWGENGVGCSNCIACCPYNKIDEWHHDLSKLATLTPAKPLLRSLDELFGYGKSFNEKAITEWWKK